MNRAWLWIIGKWATAAASNWLLVIGVTLVSVSLIYVQQLRVTVAKCKSVERAQERYDALADRLAIELERDRDAVIKSIENGNNPCLDTTIDELLNPTSESE